MPPKKGTDGDSGSRKPTKRARLPEIRPTHQNRSSSSAPRVGPDNKSWIATVKNELSTNRMTFKAKQRIRESSTSLPAGGQSSHDVHLDSPTTPPATSSVTTVDPHHPNTANDPESSLPKTNKPKRKREYTAKSRLANWLDIRDSTLDELLRHDGLGSAGDATCRQCGEKEAFFRCKDCGHGTTILCQKCLLLKHLELELHRIERWNGQFFEKTSLSSLGLRVQLGHDGYPCPCPSPGPQGFAVFDTSGVHRVNVDYCDCKPERRLLGRRVQLLRKQWFPATTDRPQTVFTFNCLDTFHESTLQGKGNLYDFYHMLLRRTDNANLGPSVYRFPEIHRVFRLWRNMMAWKRAGRGQNPFGISGTEPGGLTTECPACPHPGRNLPDDWEKAGPLLFLYTLFLAVDANFKLKGKDRKLQDVDFIGATGVFVDELPYQAHIKNYTDQPEINTCRSEHDAIVRASIRSTPGYAVSGAGLVLCSRHCLVRKNGVGDLQKGEKYCNMDFIILSALIGIALCRILITYDIACQWSKNLRKRMEEFPECMQLPESTNIETAIPRWHINGHGPVCQEEFSLSYKKGVGRTCGDEIEGSWSHTNPLAASVREMAPGARHDSLNDHWNGWNFRKIIGFRKAFSKKFKESALMQKKHEALFNRLSSTFKPALIKEWTNVVEKWEEDPNARNPYKEPANTVTMQGIRLELANEEAAEAAAGKMPLHKVTMTGFLTKGLMLEDQQYQLRVEVSNRKNNKSTKYQADIQEKRTSLLRQIHNWRQVQLTYTPHVANLTAASLSVDENGVPRVEIAEDMSLFLPSALPPHIRLTSEMKRGCDMETRLRKAEANDALAEIRRGRRNVTKLWEFKKINVSGTGNRPNTRILGLYTRLDRKIQRAAYKYRRARSALAVLDPDGAWQEDLMELRREDIRGPGKDPDDRKTTKGRFEESWIWIVRRSGRSAEPEEEEFNEDMRVEWAKSRARMMRWKEEYLLVQEEMRRVVAWFEWKATWWGKQASLRQEGDPDILAGVAAYSHKQANIVRRVGMRCATEWLGVLRKHDVKPEWASQYQVAEAAATMISSISGGDKEEVLDDEDGVEIEEVQSDEEGGRR